MSSLLLALLLGAVPGADPGPAGPAGDTLLAAHGPPAADEPREVLLDLRMGRLARRLVPALERDGVALLPAADFLELAEVRFSLDARAGLRAVRQPGNRPIEVNPDGDRVSLDGRRLDTDREALAVWNGRLYLAPELLEVLFDITIHTNWSELTAVILNPEHLPVGLRAAREARWKALRGDDPRPPADRTLGPVANRTGGMVMDWTMASTLRDPEGTTAVSGGLGGRLLGGSLQVTTRSFGPARAGRFPVSASYQIAWPRRTVVRQLRLGDGLSSGPHPRGLRGIHVTNAPYVREAFFGMDSFTGRLGPGWEVELRRHGRTLDVTRANEQGAFALDIPLSYGDNPLQVVAFGPHGEVVTMERLLLLRADRLPRGHFEWGLSAGECRDPRCLQSGNLDLRYGLTNRWTLRAGTEAFVRDTLPDAVLPYARVSASLAPSFQLDADWMGEGFVRGTGIFTPSPNLRARAALTRFQEGVEAPVLHDPRRRSTLESDLFLRPVPTWNRWTVQASMTRERRERTDLLRWQALSSLRVGHLRLDGGLRAVRTEQAGAEARSDLLGVAALAGSVPGLGNGFRSPWFRADVEVGDRFEVRRIRGRASYPLTRDARLETGASWSPDLGHHLTLSVTAHLNGMRSVTQLLVPEAGSTEVVQYAQGTVRWNDAIGGLDFGTTSGLERSGLSGYVFLDENGNGRRDPEEPGLAGVQLVIGGRTVATDERGRYSVWDLIPFEATRVEVNRRSIPNPTWVPLHDVLEVPLPPSSSRRLDIPVTRSGQVHGRVVRLGPGGHEIPVPGAELLIIDLQRKGRVQEITTFSDGGFYAMGLRPGGYELRLSPGILAGLALEPDHPRRAIVVSPDGRDPAPEIVFLLVPTPLEP